MTPQRIRTGRGTLAAAGVAFVMLAAACSATDPEVAVVPPDKIVALANDASYANATGDTTRNTPDGLSIYTEIEYFEGIRFGEWTAPEECAYNTRVRMGLAEYSIEAATAPFDGPSASSDEGDGWVGGLVRVPGSVYLNADIANMWPEDVVPGTEEYAAWAESYEERYPNGEPELDPLVAAVVAVFGHEKVVSLRWTDQAASFTARGRQLSPVDTQPLDGWAALAILVPQSVVDESGMPEVALEFVDRNGNVSAQSLTLAESTFSDSDVADEGILPGSFELEVMRDDWIFDASAVGDQCVPPVVSDTPDNELAAPDADIFQNPIANPPPLPEPGESPDDPTSATADALAAIRATYDLSAPFDDERAKYSEDPEISKEIYRAVREDDLLGPYLSNLDPVFGSLVFTSPTTASVIYRVGPTYQWEIGRVLLIDGTWRTAIGTVCRDLAAAVYTCPSTVAIDPPPGPLG